MGCCTSSYPIAEAKAEPREPIYVTLKPPSPKAVQKLSLPSQVHFGSLGDRYCKQQELGSGEGYVGSYGTVFQAVQNATGALCAVKVVNRLTLSNNEVRLICTEVSILRALGDHPNILRLIDVVVDPSSVIIVTELCTGGNLMKLVFEKKGLDEKTAATYMRQLLSAVEFCHKRRIVHRDIKLDNLILASSAPNAPLKLIDFGAATHLVGTKPLNKAVGSVSTMQPFYMAPEVLSLNYTEKCDIWSCGVALYLMLTGTPPFPGGNEFEIFANIRKARYDCSSAKWFSLSDSARDLVTQMLTKDPESRPSAAELLSHPWLGKGKGGPTGQPSFLNLLASHLTSRAETEELRRKLTDLDIDRSGLLRRELILDHLDELGLSKPLDPDVVAETLDTDYVDYSDFISQNMDWQTAMSPAVFRRWDGEHRTFATWQEAEQYAKRRRSILDISVPR